MESRDSQKALEQFDLHWLAPEEREIIFLLEKFFKKNHSSIDVQRNDEWENAGMDDDLE